MSSLLASKSHDHLTELTQGLSFPLPALDVMHIEIILDLLETAYRGVRLDYPTTVTQGSEADINALIVERLNHLIGEDALAGTLIRAVSRGTETKNFDVSRLEMRPDIQISLTGRAHLFPLIVECKLIDNPNGKTVELYCLNGLSRFTLGDYAWANQEAMMFGYVRDASTIDGALHPYLEAAMALTPPEFAVHALPVKHGNGVSDLARSIHNRYFHYVHAPQQGQKPGDIVVWHLWLN